jgi:hypothetical protein
MCNKKHLNHTLISSTEVSLKRTALAYTARFERKKKCVLLLPEVLCVQFDNIFQKNCRRPLIKDYFREISGHSWFLRPLS